MKQSAISSLALTGPLVRAVARRQGHRGQLQREGNPGLYQPLTGQGFQDLRKPADFRGEGALWAELLIQRGGSRRGRVERTSRTPPARNGV